MKCQNPFPFKISNNRSCSVISGHMNQRLLSLLIICISFFSCRQSEQQENELEIISIPYSVRGLWCSDRFCLLGADQGRVGIWNPETNGLAWFQPDLKNDSSQFRSTAYYNGSIFSAIAGSPAQIWITDHESIESRLLYSDTAAFFDAMYVTDSTVYVMGDPTLGRTYLLQCNSDTCVRIKTLESLEGEGGFAASNQCISGNSSMIAFVTGGDAPRIHTISSDGTLQVTSIPIQAGEGKGAYAIDIKEDRIAIVGGSYVDSSRTDSTIVIAQFENGEISFLANTFKIPYCSDIEIMDNSFISCGRSGIFIGKENSQYQYSQQAFYAVEKMKNFLVFTGKKSIAKLKLSQSNEMF